MDERVKEIELALKNAVYLDTGSKERGPIVAFHRDDITYLLNCIQRIPELEEGIWKVKHAFGSYIGVNALDMALQDLYNLLYKTRKEG